MECGGDLVIGPVEKGRRDGGEDPLVFPVGFRCRHINLPAGSVELVRRDVEPVHGHVVGIVDLGERVDLGIYGVIDGFQAHGRGNLPVLYGQGHLAVE